jgi:3-oxo-5-alpha-steroid 4-dehydrogenase 3
MTLLLLQVWRRLYECAFISIISPAAKINLIHYMVGYVHYFCAGAGILIEAPCFTPISDVHHRDIRGFGWVSVDVNIKKVTVVQVVAIAVFMWAWYHQKRAHSILADLRSGEDGSGGQLYRIPHGDWFRWVSCPHYLAEVIMYASLSALLGWRNTTGWVIFLWVFMNQVVAALLSHFWYQDKFEHYPAKRMAIIPMIL